MASFFVKKNKLERDEFMLLYFKQGMDSAITYINDKIKSKHSEGFMSPDGFGLLRFSTNGNKLFFAAKLISETNRYTNSGAVNVNIWGELQQMIVSRFFCFWLSSCHIFVSLSAHFATNITGPFPNTT